MNLKAMEDLLEMIVEDDSLTEQFGPWINATILAIAADFELPALKLLSPTTLDVDNSSWIWPMPEDFHKKLFRCNFVDDNGQTRKVRVYDRRDDLEFRDHTRVESAVGSVATAVQGENHSLLIDPLPAALTTLNLWYYRKPKVLSKPGDVCDSIPAEFHGFRYLMPDSPEGCALRRAAGMPRQDKCRLKTDAGAAFRECHGH